MSMVTKAYNSQKKALYLVQTGATRDILSKP